MTTRTATLVAVKDLEGNENQRRRFRPYPAYRSSQTDWLGQIPANWDVSRLKYRVTRVGSGKTPKGGATVYVSEGVLLLRSQNVYDEGLRLDDAVFIDTATEEGMASTRVEPGDVLLNITGASIGRCALVPNGTPPANVNQHVCIIRPSRPNLTPAFLHAVLCSTPTKAQVLASENGVSREGLNFRQVGNLVLAHPKLPEQEQIQSFINHNTARIDALIAKKERLIELLQEKRAALVSHAVTKGLDPDAPMKDSGVAWLGTIPMHWFVKRLKWAVTFQRGHDLPTSDRIEGDVPVISSAGPSGWHNHAAATGPGIVTGRYGTIGTFHLVAGDYWPLNTTLFSTNLHENDPQFLWYMLHVLTDVFLANSGKSAVPGVDRNDLHPVPVALPPRDEQQAIANYLDACLARFDRLAVGVGAAIEKLREYRSALISATVTGKIDVREAVSVRSIKRVPDRDLRRAVLAAEIIERHRGTKRFGSVKLQKGIILAERHLQLDGIDSQPVRGAAGPHDREMMRSIYAELRRRAWYDRVKTDKKVEFRPLRDCGGHRSYFDEFWASQRHAFDALLAILAPLKSRQVEMVGTLYMAWNDFLIRGEAFDDDRLVTEVHENWHEAKKKIGPDRWRRALAWMRQKGLVPTGFGSATKVGDAGRAT